MWQPGRRRVRPAASPRRRFFCARRSALPRLTLAPCPRAAAWLLQVTRIATGGLTIQQILEQVQSRAEEMDTLQARAAESFNGCLLSFTVAFCQLCLGMLQARPGCEICCCCWCCCCCWGWGALSWACRLLLLQAAATLASALTRRLPSRRLPSCTPRPPAEAQGGGLWQPAAGEQLAAGAWQGDGGGWACRVHPPPVVRPFVHPPPVREARWPGTWHRLYPPRQVARHTGVARGTACCLLQPARPPRRPPGAGVARGMRSPPAAASHGQPASLPPAPASRRRTVGLCPAPCARPP